MRYPQQDTLSLQIAVSLPGANTFYHDLTVQIAFTPQQGFGNTTHSFLTFSTSNATTAAHGYAPTEGGGIYSEVLTLHPEEPLTHSTVGRSNVPLTAVTSTYTPPTGYGYAPSSGYAPPNSYAPQSKHGPSSSGYAPQPYQAPTLHRSEYSSIDHTSDAGNRCCDAGSRC